MKSFNRRETLFGMMSVGAAVSSSSPLCAAVARKEYQLEPVPVADGVWMIEGAVDYFSMENGGAIVNCVLIETSIGLALVDTGPSLRYGVALSDLGAQMHPLGIAAVLNTHHHPDHFFGNQVFAGKPIHSLQGTKNLAESEGEGFSDNMYRLLGDWMRGTEVTPPNAVLNASALEIGGRVFNIYPLEGHTGSDLAVLDRKTGTLIAGDLAFLDRAPTTPSADIDKWLTSINFLEAIDAGGIVPGHGPLDRDGSSLDQTRRYLTWLRTTLRHAAAEGLDMVEIMGLDLPPEFGDLGAMPMEFHRSVSHLYPDIERQVLPLVNR